jgi:hypothetical protein
MFSALLSPRATWCCAWSLLALSATHLGAADLVLAANATQTFTATVYDQFGHTIAPAPAIVWTTTIGTLSVSSGTSTVLTAPATSGTGLVSASTAGLAVVSRSIDVEAPPAPSTTTLDMETLGVASGTTSTLTCGDYVLTCVGGSGTPANFTIYTTTAGYPSTVIQPKDWAGRITLVRGDGEPFALQAFDYAEGRWGTDGDILVTGVRLDGSTVSTGQLPFTSKVMTTSSPNWTELVSVTFNWAGTGSVSNAYGVIDNLVVGAGVAGVPQ